jgi:two-component system chemotaxis response regulator CheB
MNLRKIRVLIVDDSAIVRKILTETLSDMPDIEVAGTAPDPYVARDKILALNPDIVTLDIEMPRMDGLTFLKKLMRHHPMPVIIISSLAQNSCQIALEALRQGAVEVIAKPSGPYSVGDLKATIAAKIRAASVAKLQNRTASAPLPEVPPALKKTAELVSSATGSTKIVAIGASTGGTEAIATVLAGLPSDSPPVLIAQHIPPVFSRAFADRMNQSCAMAVKEAVDGDLVRPGMALVAPGNFHMVLRKDQGTFRVIVKDGPLVCYQRPSVDVMFSSVADAAGASAVGVILTGMGADGARGLRRMRDAGARTIAQDEASCVVFGMPKEAIRLGGADRVMSLANIAGAILKEAMPPLAQAV